MENKQINAQVRSEFGKNVNRRLRSEGFIPAVLYSHGESESIKIADKDFFKLFKGQVSESVIFDIKITDKKDDNEYMAFVKSYQLDPISDEVVHLDLFKVTKGEKIQTNIPIEIIGTSEGVRRGAILEVDSREIEIECLPKDLPEKIEVDITGLDEGDSIHANELNLSESLKLLSNPDLVIVSVHAAKIYEEEVEEEEDILEEGEGAAEEAEASTEE